MRTSIFYTIIIFIAAGVSLSWQSRFNKKEYLPFHRQTAEIQVETQARIQAYILKQQAKCKQETLEKVDIFVDSILRENAQELLMGQDTLLLPKAPSRPSLSALLEAQDTTPLKPLIENLDSVFQYNDSFKKLD